MGRWARGLPPGAVPALLEFSDQRSYTLLAVGLLAAGLLICMLVENSRFGLALMAIRQNELAAEAAGIAVVSAFPLRRRTRAVGAISVLAPGTGPLTVADADRVQLLARAAGIAIAQQREIRRSVLAASQLQRALDSRVVVEQAKGAVAARLGVKPDDAFGLLRAR